MDPVKGGGPRPPLLPAQSFQQAHRLVLDNYACSAILHALHRQRTVPNTAKIPIPSPEVPLPNPPNGPNLH